MNFGANDETARLVDILEDLGNAIQLKRRHLRLTLRDVGEATGVPFTTICRIETGVGDPRMSSLIPILRWLFDGRTSGPVGPGETP